MAFTEETLQNRFKFDKTNQSKLDLYENFRTTFLNLSISINKSCPDSRETSLAITKLEESFFWILASINRN